MCTQTPIHLRGQQISNHPSDSKERSLPINYRHKTLNITLHRETRACNLERMPTVMNQRRRNKSLCEKSAEIAINITKLSSLYLARITLGSKGPAKGVQARTNAPTIVLIEDSDSKKRLVEPDTGLASKYVMDPDEVGGVDDRASQFISRIREKNYYQSDPGIHKEASKCIPPPPRIKRAGNHYRHYN